MSRLCEISIALLACAYLAHAVPASSLNVSKSAPPQGKWFDKIVIIIFENHAEDEVIKDPNFHKYTNLGRGLENYFAITHPSQPNYFTITSGDYYYKDDGKHDIDAKNIVDLLEAKGLDWRSYQEDYPTKSCNPAMTIGKYYRKHNPFISYNNIRENKARCDKIVDLPALDEDLKNGNLPAYSFITPNIDNDAHNTNITFGGKWLDAFMSERLLKFPKGTLVVVTWDEDDYTEANKILTFLLDPNGNIFKAGTVDSNRYNHYSLLRTVEENWDLGNLGKGDKDASIIKFD